MNRLLIEESGKEQAQQVFSDESHCALGGQILAIQMINAAESRVRGDQFVGQFCDRVVHDAEYHAAGKATQVSGVPRIARSLGLLAIKRLSGRVQPNRFDQPKGVASKSLEKEASSKAIQQ